MEGEGAVVGKRAPDFSLPDHLGGTVTLSKILKKGPVLLAFYPKDFTKICTKQLCNYSENINAFKELGIAVLGISHNPASSHSLFAKKYSFPFKLLTDVNHNVTRNYGCTSFFMLGQPTRAVFIISSKQIILYRYIEPTILTHRSASELVGIVSDLKSHGLL